MNNEILNIKNLNDEEINDIISKNPLLLSSFEMAPERCIIALRNNGYVLKQIPKTIQTKEECLIAVKNAPQSLEYVSKKIIDFEICLVAVSNDGLAIRYVPQNILCQELIDKAIVQNGCSIRYLNNLSYETYKKAITLKPQAIEFVPGALLNQEIVDIAIRLDIGVLPLLSEKYLTKDLCIKFLKYLLERGESGYCLYSKIKNFPKNVRNDKKIVELKKRLNIRKILRKYFDDITKKFIIVEERGWFPYVKKYCFETFEEFYKFIDGNLYGTEFNGFDFYTINIDKYNIPQEYLPTKLLVEHGIYDETFYRKSTQFLNLLEYKQLCKKEFIEAESVLHPDDIKVDYCFESHNSKVFYISDIHLNYKIKKKFPNYATVYDIKRYVDEIVERMVKNAEIQNNDYILVAGDISFEIEISKLFYSALRFKSHCNNIVVVLGNHELWDECNNVDKIIEKYRLMLNELGIILLQNELLLVNRKRFNNNPILNYKSKHIILSENQLLEFNSEKLKNMCLTNQLCIFGGIGFSGYCSDFNAANGIYRKTVCDVSEDKKQTKRFENVYNKLRFSLENEKIIVLTHTPKENWSCEKYESNWIYVNGHTHHNDYYIDDEKTIYADNQIGYESNSIFLKYFRVSTAYDIFKYYSNGVYEISLPQYAEFNRGKGIKTSFNRCDGSIYMLKREKIYCFLFKMNNGKLYLLNGGTLNKLRYQNIEYYYSGMLNYANLIKQFFKDYYISIFNISNFVKKIGGSGYIHGCIVDIDFYNHLYINISDGNVIPYFALSVREKYIYSSFENLLQSTRKDLLENYKKLKISNNLRNEELEIHTKNKVCFVEGTEVYKPSRLMRSIQYLLESNVIRNWNDELFDFENRRKIEEPGRNL